MRRWWKSGVTGWVILSLYVVVWDLAVAPSPGGETLSSGFARGLRHPLARWPVIVAWVVTTMHLFGRLPEVLDPYRLGGRAAKGAARGVVGRVGRFTRAG